jgi:branched-chain amino acid transport system substrate-binding protein
MKRRSWAIGQVIGGILPAALVAATLPAGAAEPFRVALVEDHSVEAQHGEAGFRLGLDDATKGTLAIRGRPIELIIIHDRTRLAVAYRDRRADLAVAFGLSPTALALLPIAAAAKRILIVAEAPAEAITAGRNRYIFRTAASAAQLARAEVLALARPELNLFVAAPDTSDGREAVGALKAALERHPGGAFYVGARLVPPENDFAAAVGAEYEGFHDLHAAKTLLTLWFGASPPVAAIAATNPGRFGIRLAFGGVVDPNATLPAVAFEGVTSYLDVLPRNPANDRLVAAWGKRFHARPDGFAADGMIAAIALIAAVEAAPSTDTEALIGALEGLRFETPKGEMILRKEDHQALQVMYHFRSEAKGAPELVHEFTIPELAR